MFVRNLDKNKGGLLAKEARFSDALLPEFVPSGSLICQNRPAQRGFQNDCVFVRAVDFLPQLWYIVIVFGA